MSNLIYHWDFTSNDATEQSINIGTTITDEVSFGLGKISASL